MLFQQQMRLPIDSEVLPSDKQENEQEEGNLDQKIQSLLASREKAFKEAESNIAIAQKIHRDLWQKHLPRPQNGCVQAQELRRESSKEEGQHKSPQNLQVENEELFQSQ